MSSPPSLATRYFGSATCLPTCHSMDWLRLVTLSVGRLRYKRFLHILHPLQYHNSLCIQRLPHLPETYLFKCATRMCVCGGAASAVQLTRVGSGSCKPVATEDLWSLDSHSTHSGIAAEELLLRMRRRTSRTATTS